MARKRRRRLRWAPLLAVAAILHLTVGLALSPLTAIRQVRLEMDGAGADAQGIAQRLDSLRGRPWLLVGGNLPRSLVAQDRWVRGVEWKSNPFGFAVAKVHIRRPVAVLGNEHGKTLLTEDGMWLPGTPTAGLPTVKVPPGSLAASSGLASLSDGPRLARWVVRVTKSFEGLAEVELSDTGVLSLRSKSGPRIVFGSWDRLEDKLRRATGILAEAKPGAADVLNVTVPESPVLTRSQSKK